MKYDRIHKVLGEGNFVLVVSEGTLARQALVVLRPVPRRERQDRRALGHDRDDPREGGLEEPEREVRILSLGSCTSDVAQCSLIGRLSVGTPEEGGEGYQMVSINRILCAVDFSDFSRDALQHGLVLADWYSAQLTIFHVYQADRPLIGLPGEAFVPPVGADKVAHHVQRFCAPVLESSEQTAEIVVREGSAAREITREAEQLPADLLILGTHGRSGFERLFLGSVTEKYSEALACRC